MLVCRTVETETPEEGFAIVLGYGKCSACRCQGFVPKGIVFKSDSWCFCEHHIDVHQNTASPKKK